VSESIRKSWHQGNEEGLGYRLGDVMADGLFTKLAPLAPNLFGEMGWGWRAIARDRIKCESRIPGTTPSTFGRAGRYEKVESRAIKKCSGIPWPLNHCSLTSTLIVFGVPIAIAGEPVLHPLSRIGLGGQNQRMNLTGHPTAIAHH